MTPTAVLLLALGAYLAIGLLLAIRFVLVTAPRLDPAARAAPLRIRLLFLPGAMAVWPLVVLRSAKLQQGMNSSNQ